MQEAPLAAGPSARARAAKRGGREPDGTGTYSSARPRSGSFPRAGTSRTSPISLPRCAKRTQRSQRARRHHAVRTGAALCRRPRARRHPRPSQRQVPDDRSEGLHQGEGLSGHRRRDSDLGGARRGIRRRAYRAGPHRQGFVYPGDGDLRRPVHARRRDRRDRAAARADSRVDRRRATRSRRPDAGHCHRPALPRSVRLRVHGILRTRRSRIPGRPPAPQQEACAAIARRRFRRSARRSRRAPVPRRSPADLARHRERPGRAAARRRRRRSAVGPPLATLLPRFRNRRAGGAAVARHATVSEDSDAVVVPPAGRRRNAQPITALPRHLGKRPAPRVRRKSRGSDR